MPPTHTPNSPRGLTSLFSHFFLLLLSALLLGLSFPQPGWWPLAHVALVPMVVLALRTDRPWRLAWTSFLVALAWWLYMARWLYGVTPGGWFGLEAYMAVYTPLSLLLVRWFYQRYRSAMVLTLPMVWVSLEFIRCNYPQGGFGWFALGHSQSPYMPEDGTPWLIQIADLFGQHTVSFLVAMTNGLVADLLTRPLRATVASPRAGRTMFAAALLWSCALGGTLGYGYYRTQPRQDPVGLRVALVQTNVPQSNKDHGSDTQMAEDWKHMVRLTMEAARDAKKPDLIVWPETMVPGALNPEAVQHYIEQGSGYDLFHKQIGEIAKMVQTPLLVGSGAEQDWKPYTIDGKSYQLASVRHNSTYLYHADGTQDPLRYDKMRRVPFGEYLPWIEDAPFLKHLFQKYLSPYGEYDYTIQSGKNFTIFQTTARPKPRGEAYPPNPGGSSTVPSTQNKTIHFATPICFEDVIPSQARRLVYDDLGEKQVDMLINVTNDGWYAGSTQAYQQFQIAVLRCVENRVPMARSVNTGISGFIDSNGAVGPLVDVGGKHQEVEGWVASDVRIDSRVSLFGRLGQTPITCLIVLTALLAVGGWFRPDSRVQTK